MEEELISGGSKRLEFSPEEEQTKPCPFCAETIQAKAIKCRFCNEFLNSKKARDILAQSDEDSDLGETSVASDNLLFAARPSLFGMAGVAAKSSLLIFFGVLLFGFELEEFLNTHTAFGFNEHQLYIAAQCRMALSLGLIIIVLLLLLLKALKLKMTYYEVTASRIEWSRGIFDRRVDNLDMFRILDLKLRRSLLDCIFGIGTIELVTNDKTDPEFVFEKIKHCRRLYDILKKASLEADQTQRVVHLE